MWSGLAIANGTLGEIASVNGILSNISVISAVDVNASAIDADITVWPWIRLLQHMLLRVSSLPPSYWNCTHKDGVTKLLCCQSMLSICPESCGEIVKSKAV